MCVRDAPRGHADAYVRLYGVVLLREETTFQSGWKLEKLPIRDEQKLLVPHRCPLTQSEAFQLYDYGRR